MWASFFQIAKTTDDRGRAFPDVPFQQAVQTVQVDLAPSRKLDFWKIMTPVFGIVGLGYVAWNLATNQYSIQSTIIWIIEFGVCVLIWGGIRRIVTKKSRDSSTPSPLYPPTAWLVAHRRCGICGYDLAGISPGADGCAACPECGSAWHSDRWTLEGRELGQNWWVTGGGRAEPSANRFDIDADDRGVALVRKLSLGSCTGSGTIDMSVRESLLRLERLTQARNFRIACVIGIPAWVFTMVLYASLHSANSRDRMNDVVLVGVVSGLIALVLIIAVGRVGIGPGRVRSLLLASGTCPNCYAALKPAAIPAFDGCTACPHCGRAWESSAIDRPEARA